MGISIVGLGMDLNNLPGRNSDVIDRAEILVAGKRQLEAFPQHPAHKLPITSLLDSLIKKIDELDRGGKRVVVMADGDPLFFGIAAVLVAALGADRIRVYPNVTTLQTAASRLLTPWQDIQAISLHGRTDYTPLLNALTSMPVMAVYTDQANNPATIARTLIQREVHNYEMVVFEDLETPSERITTCSLEEAAAMSGFATLNLIILRRIATPEIPLGLGIPDNLYEHEGGVITKQYVRAAALSALRLQPGHIVWDLGAGCGSVAIEASSLVRSGRVFAVEQSATRAAMIRSNIRRSCAYGVELIHDTMPECLKHLPDPDRIFIGGGLSGFNSSLELASKRLKPGGRIVFNTVLLSTIYKVKSFLEGLNWRFSINQLGISRSVPLGDDVRLEGQNPVFMIEASKPATQPL